MNLIQKKYFLLAALLFLPLSGFSGQKADHHSPTPDSLEVAGLSLTVYNQWSPAYNPVYENEGLIRVFSENGMILEDQLRVGGRMDLPFPGVIDPGYLMVEVYVFDRDHGFVIRYGRSAFFYSGRPRMKHVIVRTQQF